MLDVASTINRDAETRQKYNDELIEKRTFRRGRYSDEKRRRVASRRDDVMPYNIIYSSSMAETAVRGQE